MGLTFWRIKLKEYAMTKLSTYDQQDEGDKRYGLPIEHGGVFQGYWGK